MLPRQANTLSESYEMSHETDIDSSIRVGTECCTVAKLQCFVCFDSLPPINNLSVKQGLGLPGLSQY